MPTAIAHPSAPLKLMLGVLEESGCSRKELLQAARIPASVDNFDALAFTQLARLYQHALSRLEVQLADIEQRPLVGKKAAEILLKCVIHSPNLASVFQQISDFYEVLGAGRGRFTLYTGKTTRFEMARLHDTPLPATYLLMQAGLASHYGLVSWLIGQDLPITEIDLACPPQYEFITSGIMQAPLRFESEGYGFSFDESWLEKPVIRTSADLETALPLFPIDLMLSQTLSEQLSRRVHLMIASMISRGQTPPNLEQAAALFNMSASTFRRYLSQEDSTYQTIKEHVLLEIARERLKDERQDLEDIALQLGFGEARSFRRAFKRWTGVSPSEFRESHT